MAPEQVLAREQEQEPAPEQALEQALVQGLVQAPEQVLAQVPERELVQEMVQGHREQGQALELVLEQGPELVQERVQVPEQAQRMQKL